MANSFVHRWTPLLATLFFAAPGLAQDSWVGQTVMPAKLPKDIKFTEVGPKGKEVQLEMSRPLYVVLKEQDGRVRVAQGGQAGWVDKDGVVLLRDAPKYFTLVINRNPENIWAFLMRGTAYFEKGELDNAVKDFDEVVRTLPDEAIGYQYRGLAFARKKDSDKSIADFTEVIRIEPKGPHGYALRANAWMEKKDFDKAIADCNQAVKLDPKNALTYVNRGHILQKKKDYGRASADFEEALKLNPKDASVHNSLGWLWATCPDAKFRDGKKAVEAAKRSVELEPRPGNMDTLAAAYAEAGDFAEAVRWQEKAMEDLRYRDNASYRRRLELYRAKMPYREE